MSERLSIRKKELKGEDGYKTFSVRIRNETIKNIDILSQQTDRSRNALINILLEFAVSNCEAKEVREQILIQGRYP